MSRELMIREAAYQSSMRMFKTLLENGTLTAEDYMDAERLMREKYKPVLGALFSEIGLT